MKASSESSEGPSWVAKWEKFIRKNPLSHVKTWQYWRDDVRPKSQFNKKFISRFTKGVKAQQKAKGLIRKGIPSSHRGEVWWSCSGGAELMAGSKSTYEDYLKAANSSPDNPAEECIMKDLHRTFISKEILERSSLSSEKTSMPPIDNEAMLPLKNILLAYSIRNPRVGYCQSMNFLCAMLLMYLDEEQAFWVLSSLVEVLLYRDYYTPSMIGSRVDLLTFQSCLAWKLPRVFSHLRSLDVILEPILCSWFLCMYLNVLSLETVQRIWDSFFFEGNVILFRIGLAIFKVLEQKILASQDIAALFSLLKKPFSNDHNGEITESLLATAFDKSWLGSIPRAALDHFRKEHQLTLSELDGESKPTPDANTEDECNCTDKAKSSTIFKGVDRSLASVLQSSESFRGKIDQRKSEDINIGVDILEDDEKEDLDEDVDDEESKDALAGEDGSIEEVSEIQAVAYRPPPNRRTSVAMKTLLSQRAK